MLAGLLALHVLSTLRCVTYSYSTFQNDDLLYGCAATSTFNDKCEFVGGKLKTLTGRWNYVAAPSLKDFPSQGTGITGYKPTKISLMTRFDTDCKPAGLYVGGPWIKVGACETGSTTSDVVYVSNGGDPDKLTRSPLYDKTGRPSESDKANFSHVAGLVRGVPLQVDIYFNWRDGFCRGVHVEIGVVENQSTSVIYTGSDTVNTYESSSGLSGMKDMDDVKFFGENAYFWNLKMECPVVVPTVSPTSPPSFTSYAPTQSNSVEMSFIVELRSPSGGSMQMAPDRVLGRREAVRAEVEKAIGPICKYSCDEVQNFVKLCRCKPSVRSCEGINAYTECWDRAGQKVGEWTPRNNDSAPSIIDYSGSVWSFTFAGSNYGGYTRASSYTDRIEKNGVNISKAVDPSYGIFRNDSVAAILFSGGVLTTGAPTVVPPTPIPNDDGGSSAGVVVGIVIGCLAAVAIAIGAVVYAKSHGKRRTAESVGLPGADYGNMYEGS